MELNKKHILLTGAARRLGRAIAESLLSDGVQLSAHYHHSSEEARCLLTLGQKSTRRIQIFQADLTHPESSARLVEQATQSFGPIDICIHCAGVFFPTPVESLTLSQWTQLFDTNAKTFFFLVQALRSKMNGGVILNLADIHATKPLKHYSAYCASKAALVQMTQSLAKELGPEIRLNSISPGWVLSPADATAEQKERAAQRTLLKRIGTPQDVVEAVHFLIHNDYMTGFDLVVDGGAFYSD